MSMSPMSMSPSMSPRSTRRTILGGLGAAAVIGTGQLLAPGQAQASPAPSSCGAYRSPYAQWSRGPRTDQDWFPVAAWLQDPKNAKELAAAGVNLFVGLWEGPTKEQLDQLAAAKMQVICAFKKEFIDRPEIVGWLYGDEPDNAQSLPQGGYGPFIDPKKVIADAAAIRAADPTRPVYVNLGRGVADLAWVGHGDGFDYDLYYDYARAADILSMDIYPRAQAVGDVWWASKGVDRLRSFAGWDTVIWNILESGPIFDPNLKPTPNEVVFEAWSSIIHGARGLVWFGHYFPQFDDHWWYHHDEYRQAISDLNHRIQDLAAVINADDLHGYVRVTTDDVAVPVDVMVKSYQGAVYVFATAMRAGTTVAHFAVSDGKRVEVLDENRSLTVADGVFSDTFANHAVHIYRIK